MKQEIMRQLEIERGLIGNIGSSLRETLDWKTDTNGAARKLSTMRFIVESFHRHLERIMSIHEYDGYMSTILKANPEMTHIVAKLKQEHEDLRKRLNRVTSRLELTSPSQLNVIESESASLRGTLAAYERHVEQETLLIQDAMLRDIGGSG